MCDPRQVVCLLWEPVSSSVKWGKLTLCHAENIKWGSGMRCTSPRWRPVIWVFTQSWSGKPMFSAVAQEGDEVEFLHLPAVQPQLSTSCFTQWGLGIIPQLPYKSSQMWKIIMMTMPGAHQMLMQISKCLFLLALLRMVTEIWILSWGAWKSGLVAPGLGKAIKCSPNEMQWKNHTPGSGRSSSA